MALENHIESLKQKHARLKKRVREEEAHFGADDTVIHRLKWEKLKVKDEIEQLLHTQSMAA